MKAYLRENSGLFSMKTTKWDMNYVENGDLEIIFTVEIQFHN